MKDVLSWVLVLVILVFVICGCGPEERIEKLAGWIEDGMEVSASLDAYIASLQTAMASAETKLGIIGLSDEMRISLSSKVQMIQEEIDKFVVKKEKADAALVEWQTAMTDAKANPNLGAELQAYGKGLGAVTTWIPPPWRPYVALGSIALNVVGGFFLKRYSTGLREVVGSVSTLLKNYGDDQRPEAKAVLKSKQSDATRSLVDKIIAK